MKRRGSAVTKVRLYGREKNAKRVPGKTRKGDLSQDGETITGLDKGEGETGLGEMSPTTDPKKKK